MVHVKMGRGGVHRKGGNSPASWLPCGWSEAVVFFFSPLAISAASLENAAGPLGAWADGATRENAPLCLPALRTRGGLSGPALKRSPGCKRMVGGRCWRESLPRASEPLAPVLGSPASVSRGGLVRAAQRPLRALVQAGEMLCVCGGESGCLPSPSPHPRITGAPPCRLKSRRAGSLAAPPSSLGRRHRDRGGPQGWVRVPRGAAWRRGPSR